MHELWASDLAPLIFVAMFAALGWLGTPVVQGLRRRIEGRTAGPPDENLSGEIRALREELAETRSRLQHLDGVGERLMELEERLDFTERMLARDADPPAVRGGEGA